MLIPVLLLLGGFLAAPTAAADTGGYPFAGISGPGSNPSTSTWTNGSGNPYSTYGYAYRNCTDYVAWKLESLGVPDGKTRGLGNGGQWAAVAEGRSGVIVNGVPAYGGAAVDTSGPYGHVAFVESVNNNGTITVSEYNHVVGGVYDGAYHQRTGTAAALGFSRFVHFGVSPAQPPNPFRIGILGGGVLDVKEGSVGATWTTVGGGDSVKIAPNRIAVYGSGRLAVKEGPLNATWTVVTGSVDEYEITANRIGIRVGTQIFVKEGGVGAAWVHVTDGDSFALSPNRIVVRSGGQLHVKEGGIGAPWTTVTGAVDDFRVTDNRVGIRVGTTVSVKEGPLNATWVHVGDGTDFDLSPGRIAVYNGRLDVKEGGIGAPWTTVTGAVDSFRVTDQLVGIRVGSTVSVKEGPLNAVWTTIGGGSAFDLG